MAPGARGPGEDTMIQAKRLGHIVLNVRNAEKSRDFYTQTLGLKVAHEFAEMLGTGPSAEHRARMVAALERVRRELFRADS